MRHVRLGIVSFMLACSLPVLGLKTDAKSDSFKSYQVKAVFIYNLTNFVSWPTAAFESSDAPIKICILGEDPFGGVLDKVVQGEKVNGRRLVVERFANIKDLSPCHILFVSPSMEKLLPQVFNATKNHNLLTVGDIEGFARLGGMVNLIPKGHRMNVEINRVSAENAGLEISSKLLNIATIVKGIP